MKRGVLYIHWGSQSVAVKERSIASLKEHHPELPIKAVELPGGASLLDKAGMLEMSPFEETLYLDVDTVVMGRLDFGFSQAVHHGIACCICENPWARRYRRTEQLRGDAVEYNTGVIFFNRTHGRVPPIFARWRRFAHSLPSALNFHDSDGLLCTMPYNDQASFAVAMQGECPFVLPLNWNFRPAWHRSFWGPIKIWHDYSLPSPWVVNVTRQQSVPGAIVDYHHW